MIEDDNRGKAVGGGGGGGGGEERRGEWGKRTAKSNIPGLLAALKSFPSATLAYAYSYTKKTRR
jgi:hypothetical protein